MTETMQNNAKTNSIIAPYYGRLDYADQLQSKEIDFCGRIDRMNEEYDTLFQDKSHDHTVLDPKLYRGIIKLDKTEYYRNKTTFSFGYDQESLQISNNIHNRDTLQSHINIGFVTGKYPGNYVIDPHSITTPTIHSIVAENVKRIILKSQLKPFMAPPRMKIKRSVKNKHKMKYKMKQINKFQKDVLPKKIIHNGIWKYLTVRTSVTKYQNSDHNDTDFQKVSTMVILTNFVRYINNENRSEYDSVITNLGSTLSKLGVDIFIISEYSQNLEPQSDDPIKVMFDKTNNEGSLLTQLVDAKFHISPFSFFQIHTEGTVRMYDEIFNMLNLNVQESKNQNIILDLYCGSGTIGQYLEVKGRSQIKADKYFDKLVGIDCVNSSIQDARKNAELNGISNSTYITGKCESEIDTLKSLIGNLDSEEKSNIYIVVDPSRDGMNKKMIKFLSEFSVGINGIRISKMIYCSCNIHSWMEDIVNIQKQIQKVVLSKNNNNFVQIQVTDALTLDMFPHTNHYEVISQIEFFDSGSVNI